MITHASTGSSTTRSRTVDAGHLGHIGNGTEQVRTLVAVHGLDQLLNRTLEPQVLLGDVLVGFGLALPEPGLSPSAPFASTLVRSSWLDQVIIHGQLG